jgi:mannose/cellobiose epimerase-like protein (N-acyl-D-glucosamine 2-epimerase family)
MVDFESMSFQIPPICQGQMVEVGYSCTANYIVRRTHDRSDRSTCYSVAEISDDDWEWYETYHPVNGEPPDHLEWVSQD